MGHLLPGDGWRGGGFVRLISHVCQLGGILMVSPFEARLV